jgi:hypothetical protein
MVPPSWAQAEKPTPSQGARKTYEGRKSVVEEDVLVVLADEPSRHFHAARADLFRQDTTGVVTGLIKGAAFLRLEADHADGQTKAALMASVRALDALAFDEEMGGGVYVVDLDRAFAQAEAALAGAHYQQAKASWGKKSAKNTGLHLQAALVSLGNSWGWSGQKPSADTLAAVKDTEIVAKKLVSGSGWTENEVQGALDKLGGEVSKLPGLQAKK